MRRPLLGKRWKGDPIIKSPPSPRHPSTPSGRVRASDLGAGMAWCLVCDGSGVMVKFQGKAVEWRGVCSACGGVGQVRFKRVVRRVEPRVVRRRRGHTSVAWSEGEVKILEEHFESMGKEELHGMLPDRTWRAICAKGHTLGKSRAHRSRWTTN